ncbi:MAG TPA: GH25 family lysozyme [Chryseolinea sp.]|nr:GH25 family lysozyme [Chryseolinea sp.]
MRKIVIVGLAFCSLTVVVLTLGYLLFIGKIRFNYPDKNEYPVLGIDISHHQGKIRWDELKKENLSFVIIKATEGGDYKDPLFTENWTNSKKEGYKTGAYHFYRLCKNGTEQAQNFIATAPNDLSNLPPTIDLEFGGNCKTDKSKEQILKEVNDFLQALEKHYNKKPILYATKEFYDEYLKTILLDHPLWIRDIFRKPLLENEREWLIWQFANREHLEGIDTYVDLNVVNGKSVEALH